MIYQDMMQCGILHNAAQQNTIQCKSTQIHADKKNFIIPQMILLQNEIYYKIFPHTVFKMTKINL